MAESWNLHGKVLISCNCDWGCPCNFNALPTKGKCEGGWTWHVEKGSFGDIKLDGLNFSVYVNWPGAIHEGNGEALVLIDERAEAAQRAAIERLLGGKTGGPWEVLGWTWPKVHGPYAVSYDLGTPISFADLLKAYGGFCKQNGQRTLAPEVFGKACTDMFGPRKRLASLSIGTPATQISIGTPATQKRRPWGYNVPKGTKWQQKLDARLGVRK